MAVAYRKRQLKVFERLLTDDQFFQKVKSEERCGAEAIWQRFFEKNPWIFGYVRPNARRVGTQGLTAIAISGRSNRETFAIVDTPAPILAKDRTLTMAKVASARVRKAWRAACEDDSPDGNYGNPSKTVKGQRP